ncbi:ArsR family transcriptional regulator [Candidatus Thorarchaeota archaeon]|nr:MAG: ArsR family transcriptional regulator [Candidatus Thorarchaeota archaeon]
MSDEEEVLPMSDLEVISDPKTIKILFEPTRAAIVFKYLSNVPMTVKQLADALDKNPGTILHHIDKLKKAGLVVQERTEQTPTGITQRFYRTSAREYRLGISGMMQTNGGVAQFAKDRLQSTVSALRVYGIDIADSQKQEAMELLRQLIEIENEVSSNLPICDEELYRQLSPSVRNDASRIMRKFALEKDSIYRKHREQWNDFLKKFERKNTDNE